MPENKKSFRSVKIGKNQTIAVIIVIIIILSLVYIWYNKEEPTPLEFTIKIVENPYDYENNQYNHNQDFINKSIYYQFKNIDDKGFYFLEPRIGHNLDFIIEAKNGTEYHYAGPVTYGGLWWQSLSPGEIENGTRAFGGIKNYSIPFKYVTCIWQNQDTGEYWFFQPGTYKVYGKYESEPNNNFENVLVGTWFSNTVTLIIE